MTEVIRDLRLLGVSLSQDCNLILKVITFIDPVHSICEWPRRFIGQFPKSDANHDHHHHWMMVDRVLNIVDEWPLRRGT